MVSDVETGVNEDIPFVVSSGGTLVELYDFDLVWQLASYINAVVSMITTVYETSMRTLDSSSSLACLHRRLQGHLGRRWTIRRPTASKKADG